MNYMNNKVLVGVVLVVVLVLGMMFPRGNSVVERVVEKTLGAVSTLDGVDSRFVSINGEKAEHFGIGMNAATSSTVCAMQASATSTIAWPIRIKVNSNGLGAQNLYISTSTSASATTTAVALTGPLAVGANATPNFAVMGNAATTTGVTFGGTGDTNVLPGIATAVATGPGTAGRSASGISNYVVKKGEWLLVSVGTSTAGTFSSYMTGKCSAVLKSFE